MPDTLKIDKISSQLSELIKTNSKELEIPKHSEIIREGQYINSVPIVTKGLVKVFTRYEEKELLLYYIQPGESCIMTFDAYLNQSPSSIYALTEENSTIFLIPGNKLNKWLKEFPELNRLFYSQYNLRYKEMIDMILKLMFEKLDVRIYDYLQTKSDIKNQNPLKISHRDIATDLGTAREVVTRILKKLELENKISQDTGFIKIL